ncbi:MAG: peptidyl-prolyl cis-trans isomerase [Candidatus Eisenbacteria bacterium]
MTGIAKRHRPRPRRSLAWLPCLLLLVGAACAGPGTAARGASTTPAAVAAAPPAGVSDTVLAVFDGGEITPTEFTLSWRVLMPNERPPGDPLAARRAFLVSMVDRELLAARARRVPVTLTPTELGELARARAQIIQNELFMQLTADLPPPTEAQLEAYRRQRTHLADIRFITFADWQPARSWRMRLTTGTPISALDELMRRGGANAPKADSFRVVAADQIPDTLATVIWAMRPGQVSEVHSFAGHPGLIHLRSFTPRPGTDFDAGAGTLRNEYRRRQQDRVRERMRVDLARTIGRTFVDPGMEILLAGFMKVPPRSGVDSVSGMPVMRANLPLPVFTAADTGHVIARTSKGELNLVSYLRYWGRVAAFARPEVKERAVLEATVDRVLLEDELVELGIARGLDKSPVLERELAQMRESFALDHYYAANIESQVRIDEAALARYFASRPGHYDDPATLEARIILVDRANLADSLLALARAGRSFPELAKEWSNDARTAVEGGMTGIVGRGTNPNVGLEDAMFATAVGQIGGPERTPEGWVLWRIETKNPGKKRTLAEAREWAERDLKTIEGEKLLQAHLAELRKKANVRLYPDRITDELGRGGDWGD